MKIISTTVVVQKSSLLTAVLQKLRFGATQFLRFSQRTTTLLRLQNVNFLLTTICTYVHCYKSYKIPIYLKYVCTYTMYL